MAQEKRSLSYEEVCQVIGKIVLDSHIQIKDGEERLGSIITSLQGRIESLTLENQQLKNG